ILNSIKNLKLLMLSASEFILPARPFRAALCAARTEFRSSYFKNTPPVRKLNFKMSKYKLILVIIIAIVLAGAYFALTKQITSPTPIPTSTPSPSPVPTPTSGRKIIPPPNQGIYIGQTQRQSGDIQAFESAVQKVAFWPYTVMSGQEEVGESPLYFDIQTAEKAWQEGYLVQVSAYEATPAHKPFTVDNLLQGKYDPELKKLAGQFRAFGKPMFFSTMREVNGLLGEWMSGFGPAGDQNIVWAFQNQKGFAEFDPQKFPNPQLYKGLGRADTCDGLERAIAAQRYYYDFFVRKEGLDFITLDTQGWAIPSIKKSAIDEGYETKLNLDCNNFSKFYNGIKDYSDWISIDWYLVTEATPQEPPISSFMDIFH